MKLIIGLGNPGEKYEKTRHNVGFRVLDRLAQNQVLNSKNENDKLKFKNNNKLQAEVLKSGELVLAKPTTFMNSSGVAVRLLTTHYSPLTTNLWVIHDDLDIKLGDYKIEFAHGPKQHNGIGSIEKELGTKDFWRVRIGIENRNNESGIMNYGEQKLPTTNNQQQTTKVNGERYVLQNFTEEEREVLDGVIERVVGELTMRIKDSR